MINAVLTRFIPDLSGRAQRNIEKWSLILFFLLPPALIYSWLVIVPVIRAIQYSLYQWNGMTPLEEFVGLGNFISIFQNDTFREALGNNAFIIVFSLIIQLPIALGLAVLLQRRLPGRMLFRTVFFLPFVLSEIITGVIFQYIWRANGGLVNVLLEGVGIDGPAWLGEPDLVMYAVFITLTWKYFGYHMILYMAGLQGIPREVEEAAMIDGADGWQTFRHVTLPLLAPTVRLTIYLSVIGSLQVFDLVWAMTTGGPIGASETMATVMFKSGFLKQLLGYGSALAIIIFLMAFIFSLAYQRSAMRRDLQGIF